jgi:hypothetical protein
LRNDKKLSIDKACDYIEYNWPTDIIPEHYGTEKIKEVHKKYSSIFRLVKKPIRERDENGKIKIVGWLSPDPDFFSLKDSAAYRLRFRKVITGRYLSLEPEGLCREIHKILNLPFESDIENEISIYQEIRKIAFNFYYIHPLRLIRYDKENEFEKFDLKDRHEKLQRAFKKVIENGYDKQGSLFDIYRQFRLIEAEDNYTRANVASESDPGEIDQLVVDDLKSIQTSIQ